MESRMMNYGMRMYDPTLGRFLSVDPLWQGFRSLSPYQYAYNSPLSYKDPTGLAPQKEQGEKVLNQANPDMVQQCIEISNALRAEFDYYKMTMLSDAFELQLSSALWEIEKIRQEFASGNAGGGGSNSDRGGTNESNNGTGGGGLGIIDAMSNFFNAIGNAFTSAFDAVESWFSGEPEEQIEANLRNEEITVEPISVRPFYKLSPNAAIIDLTLLDAVSISVGVSSIAGTGGGASVDLYISTSEVFITTTPYIGSGLDISPFSLGVTGWWYSGESSNLTMSDYETSIAQSSAGFYLSGGGPILGGHFFQSMYNGHSFYGLGANINPFSFGHGSMGITNTYLLGGWTWR